MSRLHPAARRAGLVAGPAVGVAGAVGGAALLLTERVVGVHPRTRYNQRLVALDGARAVLRRDEATERPGTYGLAASDAHAVIGDVLERADDTVTRPILRVDHGTLQPGPVALDHVHIGDPETAFGLDHEHVELAGEAGRLPAWVLPGNDTWVVVAHGLGGSLRSSLSVLPLLRDTGASVVVASYRNDPGAGPSADRRYHLGDEEWADLEVAVCYALGRGAERLVLFGWSLGGAVVLQTLVRSRHAGAVTGVILDSPVLDWRRTLHYVAHRNGIPASLVRLALTLLERRIDIDLDAFDWLARAGELALPILDFHGRDDITVPFSTSRDLAALRPDLVDLDVVPGAGHVGSWNVDPDRYARRVAAFLRTCASPAPAPSGAAHPID